MLLLHMHTLLCTRARWIDFNNELFKAETEQEILEGLAREFTIHIKLSIITHTQFTLLHSREGQQLDNGAQKRLGQGRFGTRKSIVPLLNKASHK